MWQICHLQKTKTAICGRPDRFQASKDPNQYPLDEIFLGRLPHITEIIFLKCQKLPHIGHFKLKTRHRHITFSSDRRQHFENVIIIDDEALAAGEVQCPNCETRFALDLSDDGDEEETDED